MRRLLLVVVLAALTVPAVLAAASAPGREAAMCGIPDPGDADCDGARTDGQGPMDNCPEVRNADQANTDAGFSPADPPAGDGSAKAMRHGDTSGDACDDDDDADGVPDMRDTDGDGRPDTRHDNCRTVRNPDQNDTNGNGYGEDAAGNDLCTVDSDGDGHLDEQDNCRMVPNPDQADLDSDGLGDACDPDDDADGVADGRDNCPAVANPEQGDRDGDGIGTACDPGEISSAPPPPEPTPDPATASDRSAPRLTVRSPRRLTRHDLRGGAPVSARCSEACALEARLTVARRTARRLGLRSRLLATGEGFLGARGSTYVMLEARRGAVSSLRRQGARARLRLRAVDEAGNRASATRRVRLASRQV